MNDLNKILVSIIVPVYNVELYLEKCIKSLLAQTYENIEIILSDDGSTDNSSNICDLFAKKDERIRVIHKANGGLADARNAGLDIMSGEYVTFVDSDDYLEPEAIEILLSTAIQKQSSIAHMKSYIVGSDYTIIADQSQGSREIVIYASEEYVKGMCEKRFSESVCDKMFESKLFAERRFEKGRLNEDFFFLSKLLLEDIRIAEIDYAGYNYYQRKGSITNSGFGTSLVDSVRNAFELKEIAKEINPKLEAHFARLVLFQARTLFIVIPWCYVRGNHEAYTKTLSYMRECIQFLKLVQLSRSDKVFIWATCHFPKIVLRITSILWKIKTNN